ncbi:hypothetical protein EMA8858_02944 [Emticicia aquatica]|uniref:DUF3089 domain-containing protein n=1 Tax=Emticicia aquatica TaxID=1681835 RepID=A0ABM9AS66_9BACT|nr:DUF3089 domain-containing protein [Emticicia aquatica]CAH0996809.1 hypothetical protein EMA8858_02944 [Emticicia aquatica]
MQKTVFLSIFSFLIIFSGKTTAQNSVILKTHFDLNNAPQAPNYALNDAWAALPTKDDAADKVPLKSNLTDKQSEAKADVFFLHPTTFTYEPKNQYEWNADVNDTELNQKTDNSTILNQASVFNGSGKIYAPRYRQAHYYCFLTPNADDKKQALDLAYADIKAAFEYYLKNWNQGRPIIIASHSQGTVHAKRLLKDYFDGKPLQKQLVEAYLIGIATQPDTFENIKPSKSADEIGGFVSWNTFARNFTPEYYKNGLSTAVCTNPLTWKLDEEFAPKQLNKGGVGLKYTFVQQAADAQSYQGLLWINKPYVRGRVFLKTKVWHVADINLFWMNIRENVALRLETYFKQ